MKISAMIAVLGLLAIAVVGTNAATEKMLCRVGESCEVKAELCDESIIHTTQDSALVMYGTIEEMYGQIDDGCPSLGACVREYQRDVCVLDKNLQTHPNPIKMQLSMPPYGSGMLKLPLGLMFDCAYYIRAFGTVAGSGYTIELNRFSDNTYIDGIGIDFEDINTRPVQITHIQQEKISGGPLANRVDAVFYNNDNTPINLEVYVLCPSIGTFDTRFTVGN